MQTPTRFALAALGLVLAPLAATAQHIELITEADVTFVVTYTTSVTTKTGTGAQRKDSTRSIVSKLPAPQVEIIKAMQALDLIDEQDGPAGWTFLAVRSAPADLESEIKSDEVNSEFALYAAKGSQRVPVPESIFSLSASPSYLGISPAVHKSVTTHSTRNIIKSSGTATYYTEMSFKPAFVRELPPVIESTGTEPAPGGGTRSFSIVNKTTSTFTVTSMFSTGFATIPFRTPNGDQPVFFFILGPNFVFNAKGDFSGSLRNSVTKTKKYTNRTVPDVDMGTEVDTEDTLNVGGLVDVKISLGAPKLVPRSDYGTSIPF